jgi:hypothetical protein
MKKKLAIVGTHSRTRDQAPWDDPDYEIWVFNEMPQHEWCKRWDVDFQLHKRAVYESPKNFVRGDHFEWLQQKHGKTIWMQEVDRRVPDSKRYPLEEIQACIPGANLQWFKSTTVYAIALALYLKYPYIELYGMDMASNTEYGYQLPNFQFWVGVALGMGTEIGILSNEQFFTGAMYGYEGEIQIDREFFEARAIEIKPALKSAEWEAKKLKDRVEEAISKDQFDKVSRLISEMQVAHMHAGEAKGALDEAERYAAREDPIPRQEFEVNMAKAQRDGEKERENMWHAGGQAEYVWNVWKQTKNAEAMKQLTKFMNDQLQYAVNTGYMLGKHHENNRYAGKYDELIVAAGGQRTLAALGVQVEK